MRWLSVLAFGSFAGCVIGVRAEATFTGEHDLELVQELRIDLPSTPLRIEACDPLAPALCPQTVRYAGSWLSTGGTQAEARRHAEAPRVTFERIGAFAALRAEIPDSVEGLVGLEIELAEVPGDRDLDVRTTVGDVDITGVTASITVDTEVGDVTVAGGDAGLGVSTSRGNITVQTPGHADLRTQRGDIEVIQTGTSQDLVTHTGRGDVTVELASDLNLDVDIEAAGTILVRTPSITAVTSGRLSRTTGSGTVVLEVRADGDVEVKMRSEAP